MTPDNLVIPCGEIVQFPVEDPCNDGWRLTVVGDGFSPEFQEGTGSMSVPINVAQTTSRARRKAAITLYSRTSNLMYNTCTLTQAASPYISSLGVKELEAYKENEVNLAVNAENGVQWTATIQGSGFTITNGQSGTGNGIITVKATRWDMPDARTGVILLKHAPCGVLIETYTIVQKGAPYASCNIIGPAAVMIPFDDCETKRLYSIIGTPSCGCGSDTKVVDFPGGTTVVNLWYNWPCGRTAGNANCAMMITGIPATSPGAGLENAHDPDVIVCSWCVPHKVINMASAAGGNSTKAHFFVYPTGADLTVESIDLEVEGDEDSIQVSPQSLSFPSEGTDVTFTQSGDKYLGAQVKVKATVKLAEPDNDVNQIKKLKIETGELGQIEPEVEGNGSSKTTQTTKSTSLSISPSSHSHTASATQGSVSIQSTSLSISPSSHTHSLDISGSDMASTMEIEPLDSPAEDSEIPMDVHELKLEDTIIVEIQDIYTFCIDTSVTTCPGQSVELPVRFQPDNLGSPHYELEANPTSGDVVESFTNL